MENKFVNKTRFFQSSISVIIIGYLFFGCGFSKKSETRSLEKIPTNIDVSKIEKKFVVPDPTNLHSKLSDLEYRVTREDETEPPFKNLYWNHHEEGIYVDIVSGEPLFSSRDKFESGTGWPSFTRPIVANFIVQKKDDAYGMTRVEVRSKIGDSHLGHVFDDGPQPTGLRYCINSASLRFIAKEDLVKFGYGELLKDFEK